MSSTLKSILVFGLGLPSLTAAKFISFGTAHNGTFHKSEIYKVAFSSWQATENSTALQHATIDRYAIVTCNNDLDHMVAHLSLGGFKNRSMWENLVVPPGGCGVFGNIKPADERSVRAFRGCLWDGDACLLSPSYESTAFEYSVSPG